MYNIGLQSNLSSSRANYPAPVELKQILIVNWNMDSLFFYMFCINTNKLSVSSVPCIQHLSWFALNTCSGIHHRTDFKHKYLPTVLSSNHGTGSLVLIRNSRNAHNYLAIRKIQCQIWDTDICFYSVLNRGIGILLKTSSNVREMLKKPVPVDQYETSF
jgi:hypothetical protein